MDATPRLRRRVRARQLLPPIQIAPTGEPISIADAVVKAIVIAVALALIQSVVGVDPTDV